jgi:hypothetical protein
MEDSFVERRKEHLSISEELLEQIAEKAAEKAIIKMENKLYTEVGKSFIAKFTKVVGIIIIGLFLYITKGDLTKVF